MTPLSKSSRALFLITTCFALAQLSNVTGDEVIMLHDVYISTADETIEPSKNNQKTVPRAPIHLLSNKRYTLVSETDQHVVISHETNEKIRHISIPRQDVRIQRVPIPTSIPTHLLTALKIHLTAADQHRTTAYNKLGKYRRKHRATTESLDLENHITLVNAQVTVDIAEIVLAYQSLRDNARENSRSSEILHEELSATLDAQHQQNSEIIATSETLAPLQKTASELDHLNAELAKLDKVLAGRKDKSILLTNRTNSPFVLKNLRNVINNVQEITKRYEAISKKIDNLPRKHSGLRHATIRMKKIKQHQIELTMRLQDLQSKLSILQDITATKATPIPTEL